MVEGSYAGKSKANKKQCETGTHARTVLQISEDRILSYQQKANSTLYFFEQRYFTNKAASPMRSELIPNILKCEL